MTRSGPPLQPTQRSSSGLFRMFSAAGQGSGAMVRSYDLEFFFTLCRDAVGSGLLERWVGGGGHRFQQASTAP